MRQMVFLIEEARHDELKERVRDEGLSMGNVLRGLIDQYLGHGAATVTQMGRPVTPTAPKVKVYDDIAKDMMAFRKHQVPMPPEPDPED